jgi:TonB family protein
MIKTRSSSPFASVTKSVSASRTALLTSSLSALLITQLVLGPAILSAQTPAPAPATPPQAAPTPAAPQAQPSAEPPANTKGGEITEEEVKSLLVGKQLFLRGGYLGESLSFDIHGDPTGNPVRGSYTLSAVQIDKVSLTKHHLELEGVRYAIHFLGDNPYDDPGKDVERVRITPKKKTFRVTIQRELVSKTKKEKDKFPKGKVKPAMGAAVGSDQPQPAVASSETDPAIQAQAATAPTGNEPKTTASAVSDPVTGETTVTVTISPATSAALLRTAITKIFAFGIDDKLKAQMPDYWQLYYEAQATHVAYHSKDPNVYRANAVDQQAKLTSSIAPDSNEFAQASGIAGRALYRAVIGPDGRPAEIAVLHPIGFGLDEKAVDAIRKATFQPAIKAGKPVGETLDLGVMFRIYSKRTSVAAATEPGAEPKPAAPIKPGPFTVRAPQSQPAADAPPATEAPKQPDSSQPQLQDPGADEPAIVIPAEPVTPPATDAKPAPKPDEKPAPPTTPNQP